MNDLIEYMIGKPWDEMKIELKETNPHLKYRIVENDGKHSIITSDYQPNRLNITLANELITKITLE